MTDENEYSPKNQIRCETGREHQEIQDAKVGFLVPWYFVLRSKTRDGCIVALQLSIAIGRSAAPQEVHSTSDYKCETNNPGNVCTDRPAVASGSEVVTKLYDAVNVRNLRGQASSSFDF